MKPHSPSRQGPMGVGMLALPTGTQTSLCWPSLWPLPCVCSRVYWAGMEGTHTSDPAPQGGRWTGKGGKAESTQRWPRW